MGAGFGLWDQMGEEQRELQRRWAAGDAFADWTPAWHASAYQSADLQIAAPGVEAIERGDFLVVLGDFHGGDNPLAQGLFGLRHPDPAAMMRRIAEEAGPGVHLSPPRRGVVEMTARSWPLYPEGDIVVVGGDEPTPPGAARVALEDVVVHDGHVSDRAGTFRAPLAQFLYLPIFVAALRSFDPIGRARGPRTGRPAGGSPRELVGAGGRAPRDLGAWARDRGLPRRVFARSPLERKPQVRRLREPLAAAGAVALPGARARARAGSARRVHRDAPRARGLLARERRRAPHVRAARRRARPVAEEQG